MVKWELSLLHGCSLWCREGRVDMVVQEPAIQGQPGPELKHKALDVEVVHALQPTLVLPHPGRRVGTSVINCALAMRSL